MAPFRLEIPDCPPALVAALQAELGVSRALGQVLVRRGLADPVAAAAFLAAGEEHPPEAFAGIGEAVACIHRHIVEGSQITIHGDYDVDGICSTAILVRAVGELGGNVDSFLPDRAGDGYGLAAATVERLAVRGTRLLITADCAITAVEEVARARELGLDVVVSDHHSPRPDGLLPQAPIVHPAVCGYPYEELCATAVAYKLAQALYARCGRDAGELRRDLDLVALATIADVVPLTGENRALVRRGLRALAGTARPGLRALMAVARVDSGRVDERAVAFALAPRLNAAGRLYRADAGLELILTGDPARGAQIARELDSANAERRQIEQRIRFAAEAQMRELGERGAYVLAGEDWHAGVIGIVASRLVEQSGCPVVLVALDGERGRGSGRSVEAFDLLGGLRACADHLGRYGGHRAAAGLELERGQLAGFAAALAAHAEEQLTTAERVPLERVDAVVEVGELDMALAEELASLAPFGRGNPEVRLMLDGAEFTDARPMGEGRHVRFTVQADGARARAVAFGCEGRLPVPAGTPAEATFKLEVNEWNGVSEPRLVLRRARPAAVLESAPDPLRAPELEPAVRALSEPVPAAAKPAGAGPAPIAEDAAAAPPPAGPEEQELVLFALP